MTDLTFNSHLVANVAIALAYATISITAVLHFAGFPRDARALVVLAASFVLSCGIGHLFAGLGWTQFLPAWHWVTAIISWAGAIAFAVVLPKILRHNSLLSTIVENIPIGLGLLHEERDNTGKRQLRWQLASNRAIVDLGLDPHDRALDDTSLIHSSLSTQAFFDVLDTDVPILRREVDLPHPLTGRLETYLISCVSLPGRYLWVLWQDITDRQRAYASLQEATEKLEWQATHDYLTQAGNLVLFDRLQLEEPDRFACVLSIDIARFKSINETLGHSVGDLILQRLVKRFSRLIGDRDAIVRTGADGFLILLETPELDESVLTISDERDILPEVIVPPSAIPTIANASETEPSRRERFAIESLAAPQRQSDRGNGSTGTEAVIMRTVDPSMPSARSADLAESAESAESTEPRATEPDASEDRQRKPRPLTPTEIGQRFYAELRRPFIYHDRDLKIDARIGFADRQAGDLAAMRIAADIAMCAAKSNPLGERIVPWTTALMDRVCTRQEIALDLERALQCLDDEFELYYQPIVRLGDPTQCYEVEALLRWNSSVLGRISPGIFIPLAEETGAIAELSDWVVERSIAQVKQWKNGMRIALNVSPWDLERDGFADRILRLCAEYDVLPSRIALEITERAVTDNLQRFTAVLKQLAEAGIRLKIDDFGTGDSGLGRILEGRWSEVKIDRSLLPESDRDLGRLAICRAIAILCHDLNIRSLAEGIETEDQRLLLHELNIEDAQGYLFAKPMPQDELMRAGWVPGG